MKKIEKLLFVVMIYISTSAVASGRTSGDFVGNGGGLQEARVFYAMSKLPKLIESCLFSQCVQGSSNFQLLMKIQKEAISFSRQQERVLFLSGKEYPHIFNTQDIPHVRFAVVEKGDSKSPIFINTDILYSEIYLHSSDDLNEAIVVNLIHELGHIVGEDDHKKLDILANNLRLFFESSSQTIYIEAGIFGRITASAFNYTAVQSRPSIIIEQGNHLRSIDSELKSLISCKGELLSYGIGNLHWGVPTQVDSWGSIQQLNFWIISKCLNDKERIKETITEHQLRIVVSEKDALRILIK